MSLDARAIVLGVDPDVDVHRKAEMASDADVSDGIKVSNYVNSKQKKKL